MSEQAYTAGAVAALALAGVVGSNVLRDRGLDASISRGMASAIGGAAFLLAVLWMDPWPAVAVAAAIASLLLGLRLRYRHVLRGTEGRRVGQLWSQVTYAIAGTASLAVGWGLMGDRWLAFLPIAFMAWGDAAAGMARATLWRGRVLSIWPSVVMLGVCLAVGSAFTPLWVGAPGAMVATAAERYRPMVHALWDDNLNVVAVSLTVMAVLAKVTGI